MYVLNKHLKPPEETLKLFVFEKNTDYPNKDVPTIKDVYSSEESCRLISQLIQNHWTDQEGIQNPHGGRNPVTSSISTPRQGHWVDSEGTPLPDSEINVLESIVGEQNQ